MMFKVHVSLNMTISLLGSYPTAVLSTEGYIGKSKPPCRIPLPLISLPEQTLLSFLFCVLSAYNTNTLEISLFCSSLFF